MRRSRDLSVELVILLSCARPIDRGVALPLTDSLSEFLAFRFRGLLQRALPADASYREPLGMPLCFVQGSIQPYARTRRHKRGILLLSA
jgi:hypothetical protein